jgi:tRNA(Ser,Leu) C12 N-acetylase TAN1
MHDWNVVVTAHDKGYTLTCELLEEIDLGPFVHTDFYNVIVMKAPDTQALMAKVEAIYRQIRDLFSYGIARVAPAQQLFDFQSPEEFESKAREVVLTWLPSLAGKSFHVRLHRRGFKGRLSTPEEERFLDDALLEALQAAGTPGSLSFDDPDAIIQIETVGNRAGLSLWTREDLARYPFLRVD